MKNVLFLFLSVGIVPWVLAQGPPITTDTPVMLGLEGSGVRTFGKFINKENANIYVHIIGVPYNITNKWQIGGIIPFKFITPNNSKTNGGIGDFSVFTKYQLYKKDGTAKTFRILAMVKQSFPSGRTATLPAIGSGLYQTYFGLIIGRVSSKVGMYSDFGYTATSTNATDLITYNFSIGVPLLPQKYPQKQINTFLEFNGKYMLLPQVHTLFVSPGTQFILGRRLLIETSFQIPIIQSNVFTNRTKYMFLLGTRFLLN